MISLFILSVSLTCIDKAKKAEAGMILLTSDTCNRCSYISNIIKSMKPLLPKSGYICSKSKVFFTDVMTRKPNFDVPNFALYRKGELISIMSDNLTEKAITKTMNALLNPPVYFVDENNVSLAKFYQTEKTVIFRSPEEEDFEPFYQAAIHFRDYPITFLVGRGDFSASLIDNFRKRTVNYRGYPESLIEWVMKIADITPPLPYHAPNTTLFLYVTYGSPPQETDNLFNHLSFRIGEHISLGYANWDRDRTLFKNCSISPADGTYLAIRPNGKCYPFVDDDVVTPELMSFFLGKVVNGYYDKAYPCASTVKNFGRVVPLDAQTILKKIPSHKCTVLHLSNSASTSHSSVSNAFARVARKFTQANLGFYEMDSHLNWAPSYVPNNDGFPMIAMWRPNDKRPFIFREILTNGALANWVLAKAISVCNLTMI